LIAFQIFFHAFSATIGILLIHDKWLLNDGSVNYYALAGDDIRYPQDSTNESLGNGTTILVIGLPAMKHLESILNQREPIC
jgi:hypothetical protein